MPLTNSPVHYDVQLHAAHTQTYTVTLTIAHPAPVQRLSLPVWIAGSYLVREFSKHLHSLSAECAGQACRVEQIDKHTWDVHCGHSAGSGDALNAALQVHYHVVAADTSVRTAWLSAERGFFNGTSLLLRVHGCEHMAQRLHIARPSPSAPALAALNRWQLATALEPLVVDGDGWGTYTAADYETLVDAPVEMGTFWSGTFEAGGIAHRFVVTGAPQGFDGQRLLHDTQRICQAQIDFWHPPQPHTPDTSDGSFGLGCTPPHRSYVFLLHATPDGYGGLEHRNSTALICAHADLPQVGTTPSVPTGGYLTLLGLISHEYFHTWNVKRLRPAEFARIDLERENYTELLWFFEGLTSYWDDLILRRCGLIGDAAYLGLLAKNWAQVLATPGRHIHSAAAASFEAWTKYYRADAHTPNITVSYYSLGALIGLCIDLQLRADSAGCVTLDDLMRRLWQRSAGGPISHDDICAELIALQAHGDALAAAHAPTAQPATSASDTPPIPRADWSTLLHRWVRTTQALPVAELLAAHGVGVQWEAPSLAQRLGLRVQESADAPVRIQHVLTGGAAQAAGMIAGDVWWGIECSADTAHGAAQAWSLRSVDDLKLYAAAAWRTGQALTALVERDRRILRLSLHLPSCHGAASDEPQLKPLLHIRHATLARNWLGLPTAHTRTP